MPEPATERLAHPDHANTAASPMQPHAVARIEKDAGASAVRQTVLRVMNQFLARFRAKPDFAPAPAQLPGGTPAVVVPLRPDHAATLSSKLELLSMRSRAQRFLHPKTRLSPRELQYLTQCDGVNHLGLALIVTDAEAREIAPVAVARCVRSRRYQHTADVAVTVLDAWQGLGVGKALLRDLARRARRVGIRRFRGTLWADNAPARALLDEVGVKVRERAEDPGVVEVIYRLTPPGKDLPPS